MKSIKTFSQSLAEIRVRPVEHSEEARYQSLMAEHHYLGALPKIGETLWYVATWQDQWVEALINMSGAALKCGVRDRWIGWDFRSQYGRLDFLEHWETKWAAQRIHGSARRQVEAMLCL